MTTKLAELIPFNQAPEHIPGHPTVATLHRWRTRGCNGRRLRTLKIGGKRFIEPRALVDFIRPDVPRKRRRKADHL